VSDEFGTVIAKLDKDLKKAAGLLGREEARLLVDSYYQQQEDRIRSGARARAAEPNKTSTVLSWVGDQSHVLERHVAAMLDAWSAAQPMGPWLRATHGIGPVISAGLLAHLDIEKAPTAGHFWAIAGLDPSKKWLPKTKRPWNASLKRLCYLISESFVKTAGSDKSFYGPVYRERKAYEWAKNQAGDYAGQAAYSLEHTKFRDEEALSKKWYQGAYTAALLTEDGPPKGITEPGKPGVPMLPPARIHARARRYAVKLFLAHLHGAWFEHHFHRPPPLPYATAHLGHAHVIPPPAPPPVEAPKRKKRAA
jgi:Transposase IS116/IS110/IS902 family